MGSMFRNGPRCWRSVLLSVIVAMAAGWIAPARAQEETSPPNDSATPAGYRIGPGDVLQILVWREPEASVPDAVVRVDGKIALPLIGEVEVVGLTPAELKEVLAQKLSGYINTPAVTVLTREVRSRRVYVVGSVRKEGPIPLLRPMTIVQAIMEAGGLGEWAQKKKIYVLRTSNGKQTKMPFDYGAFLKGNHTERNITLLPDDMVVVPPGGDSGGTVSR